MLGRTSAAARDRTTARYARALAAAVLAVAVLLTAAHAGPAPEAAGRTTTTAGTVQP
ncbi:hypothetical protein NX794_32445 [Streptomyces sp. LP11]|uniref:Uncharacterized protein n=1 Tax=Streptomyces pyxinicus TaxID=2970331 RepID=A0ABT2BCU4_9ACTN|nr:hypothetical protein [Streptomyces sp. LP11]MCS0605880.1 hypothetical protein [Streptomyces sp. LP11]